MTDQRATGSLWKFRRLSDAWHVCAVEFWGWLSAQCLVRIARHAEAADDLVTLYRVREVLHAGVKAGWTNEGADGGRLVPRRTQDEIVPLIQAEVQRRVEESKRA